MGGGGQRRVHRLGRQVIRLDTGSKLDQGVGVLAPTGECARRGCKPWSVIHLLAILIRRKINKLLYSYHVR